MMGLLYTLIGGVLLPWITGAAVLALANTRSERCNSFAVIGYGLPLGLLITTLLMRVSSALPGGFSFAVIAGALLAVTAAALVIRVRHGVAPSLEISGHVDWVVVVLLALIVFRFAHLLVGAAVQPLVGADTWWFWASKARVWFETGHMAPFVSYNQWVAADHAGAILYADPKPYYPALVPLSKTWIALAMGRWDEALSNAFWPALYLALLCAFYGQLRLSLSARYSLLFTALLASLPMLNMNVFGAGLADLFVGVGFGLAAMALYQCAGGGERWQWIFFAVGVVFCASAKTIGVVLVFCLAPGVALVLLPRRLWWWLMGLGVAAVVLAAVAYVVSGIRLLGVTATDLELAFRADRLLPFLYRIFLEEGWHLLWGTLAVGVVASLWQRRMDQPAAAVALSVLSAFILLAFVFTSTLFASRSGQDAVPRHLLHVAPAALFLCAVIWSRLLAEVQNFGSRSGIAR